MRMFPTIPIMIPMLFVIERIVPAYGAATSWMCAWKPAEAGGNERRGDQNVTTGAVIPSREGASKSRCKADSRQQGTCVVERLHPERPAQQRHREQLVLHEREQQQRHARPDGCERVHRRPDPERLPA